MTKQNDRSDELTTPALTARGVRTRQALKCAARKLFEDQGFQDTSVNDISTQAAMAYGTFYRYFDSKEQVFAELGEDLFHSFSAMVQSQPRSGAHLSERIERSHRGYMAAYRQNALFMAAVEQAATLSPALAEVRRRFRFEWVNRNAKAIRRWQRRGEVDSSIDPIYAAEILGAMVERTAYLWIVLGTPFNDEKVIRQLSRLYCNALGVPYRRDEARQRRNKVPTRKSTQSAPT